MERKRKGIFKRHCAHTSVKQIYIHGGIVKIRNRQKQGVKQVIDRKHSNERRKIDDDVCHNQSETKKAKYIIIICFN